MLELQLLALARLPAHLFVSRYGCVRALRAIAAEREPFFEFLSDVENHWLLAEGFVEQLAIGGAPDGRERRRVRLRGPLGVPRRARTSVIASVAPRLLIGRAELGRRTVARVSWVLMPVCSGATAVELSAVVERVALLDALVLRLGGRDWLERRFEATLRVLAELAATAGEEEDRRGAPSSAVEGAPVKAA